MATRKTFLTIDEYRASGLYKDESNDQALEKLLMLASQKIDMVSDLGLSNMDSPIMTQEQLDALKEATSIVVDHWNSGGWDWKRNSGSASLSSLSASINRMDNNDIVPQIAIDVLQRVGLYSPIESIDFCEDGGVSMMDSSMSPQQGFSQAQLNYLINNFIPSYAFSAKQDMLPISPGGTNNKDYIYVNKHGQITIALLEDILTRNGYSKGGSGTVTPTTVSAEIPWLTDHYSDIANFGNTAKMYEIVKYNLDKTGANNVQGFQLIVKTPGGLKEIRTWEEIKTIIDSIKADIATNKAAIAANTQAITSANTKITGVEAKADQNAANIAQLATEIQVIENTWTGNQALTGGTPTAMTFDLKTINGDKGAFTHAAGDKLNIKLGINGTAFNVEHTMRVNEETSFHIAGRTLDGGATTDVTLTAIVAPDGTLIVKNFHSSGTTNQNISGVRIRVVEQNPKVAAAIDLTGYLTQTAGDARYELKGQGGSSIVTEYTSAKELYDSMESGTPISNADTKHINADTAGEIIKNQHEINRQFLSEFSDNVYYMSDTTMEYRDTDLDLITLDAAVTTTLGNPVTVDYSSLISPYDRISQDQASFEATMNQAGMKIQYLFTAKGKAVRFSGNVGSKYKWETVTKFNTNGTSAKYIKFTGDATLEVKEDALNPSGAWAGHNMPYEVPLSEFMDDSNRTALVQMNFTTKPAAGSKVASIDYKTAAHFYAQREEALFKAQAKLNDAKYEIKANDYSGTELTLTEQTQGGHNYIILSRPAGADDTLIGTGNQVKIQHPTSPLAHLDAQVTYGTDLLWINKAAGNIMNWNEIQNEVAADKIMVIKRLDNTNWELVRWENSPSAVDLTGYYTSTQVDTKLGERDTRISTNATNIAANTTKINALSGGVKVYHYSDKTVADAAIATGNFHEGDLAWIGSAGDWIGYHFIGNAWVLNGTTSTHAQTPDASTILTKTLRVVFTDGSHEDFKVG